MQVEGPFRIFLRDKLVGYFILRAEARPPPEPQKKEDIDGEYTFTTPQSILSLW